MFLLFCQVLEKQPFFLFSVHIFYSVKVKQWRRLELRLVLGIIGAHSWVHRISKRHYFKGQKFKVLFFFSELVCGEHYNCPSFIVLSRQISLRFQHGWAEWTNLNWTKYLSQFLCNEHVQCIVLFCKHAFYGGPLKIWKCV